MNQEQSKHAGPPLTSEFKSKSGIRRIYAAWTYSLAGLRTAWQHEHAFRQELLMFVAGTALALALPLSIYQTLLLVCVMLFVLIVELVNSAIEAIVDRISLERHPLSKNAKDLGSAAVLLAVILAKLCWVVVLFDRFY